MEHFITIVLWIISSYCSAAYASHGKVLYMYIAIPIQLNIMQLYLQKALLQFE